MFPEIRSVRFLLAIALKLNAVFVPFFFFFFLFFLFFFLSFYFLLFFSFFLNQMIILLGYKIMHADYAMAQKKPPSTPGKKPTPQVPLCGTNGTSRPQQETLH